MNSPRPRLDPATAETRRAVRVLLETARADGVVTDGDLVLVALSGGADSLALAAATAFEAPKQALRAGAVVVDHALQEGSAEVAIRASRQAASLGLDPVTVRRVAVGSAGGPENAAREARHTSIAEVASATGSPLVLFGHTLDDQAETVLLGLLRGSGPDALSGMPPLARRTVGPAYGRPLLGVRRHTTRAACVAAGLAPWDDPQNDDPAYGRVRVRTALMPALERELGAGVPEALARTADQLREDSAALDHFAEEMAEDLAEHSEAGISLSVRQLAANPPALRQRLVRLAVESEFGVTLSRVQTLEVCRLVTDWHGQGPIALPGVSASRDGDRLAFAAG
ncbi:tRNA(Ile)-lysidine synthase [Curtobacterium luteum]|uniref:tRNA(Ile)-lysidine synthase n=1 Tax=Curtobacterium luteum TaxID=33881 RepID=A0ABS2RZI5_9MICO|nr:tRNA lysidine(34) synthetase TilS [Curtobacterium luteum]MBM7803521.1 tRNA(Ile)-lysidine synthase [Curtobacterium luteum]NUU50204.1 tRNA lysidine(34) synthetase TilS [Curtobacterium luteum]